MEWKNTRKRTGVVAVGTKTVGEAKEPITWNIEKSQGGLSYSALLGGLSMYSAGTIEECKNWAEDYL